MKKYIHIKGFSLVEALSTLGVIGILMSIFSVLIIQLNENQKRIELYSIFQNEISSGLKVMSNPRYVGKIIGLYDPNTPLFNSTTPPAIINNALLRCLSSDQTSGCEGFQTSSYIEVPSESNPSEGVTRKAGSRDICSIDSPANIQCPITRKLSYQLLCDNSRCRSLNLKLSTEIDSEIDTLVPDFRKKFFMRKVEHNMNFNSLLLTSQSTIESTCSGAPAREIDFNKRALTGCHATGLHLKLLEPSPSDSLYKNNPIEDPSSKCEKVEGCKLNVIYETSCKDGFSTAGMLTSKCFIK